MNCTINDIDAYSTYGFVLDETSLSALMTPVGIKDEIKNESRLEHGTEVIDKDAYVRLKERNITIKASIVANTREQFYQRYEAFCQDILSQGRFHIKTEYQPGVIYKCRYKDCQQMTYYNGTLAKFSISLYEPNPSDRKT